MFFRLVISLALLLNPRPIVAGTETPKNPAASSNFNYDVEATIPLIDDLTTKLAGLDDELRCRLYWRGISENSANVQALSNPVPEFDQIDHQLLVTLGDAMKIHAPSRKDLQVFNNECIRVIKRNKGIISSGSESEFETTRRNQVVGPNVRNLINIYEEYRFKNPPSKIKRFTMGENFRKILEQKRNIRDEFEESKRILTGRYKPDNVYKNKDELNRPTTGKSQDLTSKKEQEESSQPVAKTSENTEIIFPHIANEHERQKHISELFNAISSRYEKMEPEEIHEYDREIRVQQPTVREHLIDPNNYHMGESSGTQNLASLDKYRSESSWVKLLNELLEHLNESANVGLSLRDRCIIFLKGNRSGTAAPVVQYPFELNVWDEDPSQELKVLQNSLEKLYPTEENLIKFTKDCIAALQVLKA